MKKVLFFILLSIGSSFLQAKNNIISLDSLPTQKNSSNKLGSLLDYVNKNKKLVILKFYADWCKPCKRMKSIVESVAEQFSEQISIISINIDSHKHTSNFFSVRYIPTLVFMQDGKEIKRTNSIGKEEMINIISSLL